MATINDYLSRQRISLFGHVARMDEDVPDNSVMRYFDESKPDS